MTFIEESKHAIFFFAFCHVVDLDQHNSYQAFACYCNRTSFSK